MCISELDLVSKTCGLQGTFIVFQDKVKPGKNFTGTQLFDTGGAFYNVPGFMDNLKVSMISSIIYFVVLGYCTRLPRGCQQLLLRLRPYPVRGHRLLCNDIQHTVAISQS